MKRTIRIAIAVIVLALGILLLRYLGVGESVAGVDANHDGIRDDVEALIEQKYSFDPKVRSATRRLAWALQEVIVNPDNAEEKNLSFALDCLRYVSDQSYDIGQAIQAASANNYVRTKALLRDSARFSGKILMEKASREEACAFDPSLTK